MTVFRQGPKLMRHFLPIRRISVPNTPALGRVWEYPTQQASPVRPFCGKAPPFLLVIVPLSAFVQAMSFGSTFNPLFSHH